MRNAHRALASQRGCPRALTKHNENTHCVRNSAIVMHSIQVLRVLRVPRSDLSDCRK